MLKEAIEKIEKMAAKPFIAEIGGVNYLIDNEGAYTQIQENVYSPSLRSLYSLDAVVKMVRNEAQEYATHVGSHIFVSVPKHNTVVVFLEPDEGCYYERTELYQAIATDIPGWDNTVSLPFDQAAVAIQTRFQDGGDRDYTLRLLSMISTGAKITYNDTGIATNVVTQRGVALQENSQIKPLVRLRPYRTFQEVEQPEGLFLIRISEKGITFTEADGGMWKLTARKTVAAYLEEAFKDLDNVIVML